MKKVLLIAYYFPPSGGAGVQRILKFAKHLPRCGWEPVVLTVAENADFPARDASLLGQIPAGTRIIRTPIFEPYRLYRRLTNRAADEPTDIVHLGAVDATFRERLASFLRSSVFIPDARVGWLPFGTPRGIEAVDREGIDLVFSTSPPYTTSLLALLISGWSGRPWVADFRDPWTDFFSAAARKSVARRIDLFLEGIVCKKADRITVAWEGIASHFRKKHPLSAGKSVLITNGFDPEDVDAHRPPKHDRFVITHAGSLYGKRNPARFLDAVKSWLDQNPELQNLILIRIIGRVETALKRTIQAALPETCVQVLPYMSHPEMLRLLKGSDLLLLIMDDIPEADSKIPLKFFEYVGARKPVLALTPRGEVSRLLDRLDAGWAADPDDAEAITDRLRAAFREWNSKGEIRTAGNARIASFEWSRLTEKLVEVFDRVVEKG